MNKFLTKIIGASLAAAMMVGVGVGANANKQAKELDATGETWASVSDTFELATSISAGDEIIIVSSYADKAMGAQGSNNRSAADVTKEGTLVSDKTVTVNALNTVALITVETTEVNNTNYFNFAVDGGYLYDASTSSKNYLRKQNTVTDNGYADWTVNINNSGIASITARAAAAANKLVLSYNTGNALFACYSSLQTNGGLEIYKKVASASVVSSVEASIKSGTYYTGSTLSASDFDVTVKWTGGKADTNPTEGFTWTVNGVANGTLNEGNNTVVVTYSEVSSPSFTVVGTTIHATAVEISEETATLETIGETLTLTATITPANAVETVSWSTSDEAVATVDDNGEVTAVAAGTATITATAGSVSDTCEVTVYNRSKATISFGKKDYNIAKPTETQDEISNALIDGYDFNLLNAHNSGATYEYIMFATNNLGTEESLVANKTAIPGAITRIVFNIRVGSSGKAIYNAILSNSSVTTTVSDSTYTRTGAGTLTIEADSSSNYHFFAISCVTTAGNGQLASIDVFYVPTTVKTDFHALETQTTLSYRYEKNAQDEFSYSDISIRFGALVSKNLWDEINTIYDVAGFGVMIASGNTIKDFETFEEYAEFAVPADQNPNIASELIDYYVENDGTFEIPLSNNSYYWNLRFSIPESDMHVTYTAAAYIKIGSELIFMQKARESVETLALDYLQNRGCDATTAGGSLKNIVDQSQMS